eukprot:GHVR01111275.1.p1 GENE.GHVR01111275.1~~GHVR01111275.1.p1  ORF type:complete len:397 (+),score=64.79 GHVR01111275.1:107-1297(+)
MSQFKDTFTKDQKKEPLLDYDDTAFLYFAGTILFCILVPWTISLLKSIFFPTAQLHKYEVPLKSPAGSIYQYCQCSFCRKLIGNITIERKKWKNRFTRSILIQVAIVLSLWGLLVFVISGLSEETQINQFDPFEILEIVRGASDREIKKAYRVASLKSHPDKNPNDPLAASKFMLVAKAYSALVDEVAKANYEKYGNPDGPSAMKVGIGLPRFLVEEKHQLPMLVAFFFILLFVIPLVFLSYYNKQKNYASNGLHVDTLQFLSHYVTEGLRSKSGPEYIAASAESRALKVRNTDAAEMPQIMRQCVEPKKRQFNHPVVVRNYFLILAHMQRLHEDLSENLLADLNTIFKSSMSITNSMVEIASIRDYSATAMSLLEFKRQLIQALDVKSSSLLQVT